MSTKEPLHDIGTLAPRLAELRGWRFENNWLVREYKTPGWRVTLMVVNAVGYLAEAANHHPDLEVHWGSVVVRLQTHSAGGVTDKDLDLADRIQALVLWRPNGSFPGLEGSPKDWIAP